jgi:hypothetical protein
LNIAPQRGRDLGRRERPGGDLVDERLEEVEVAPVDEGHRDRRVLEVLGGLQPAEPAADHDHAMHAGTVRDGGGWAFFG